MALLAWASPAAAHGGVAGTDVRFAQTVAGVELAVVMRASIRMPVPPQADVVVPAPPRPGRGAGE
ncbi:hypothetical protein ACFQVD_27240 [Streptosporangium amethystogenes subsp. fukuiense]|uniref:Uncharacterized protein n=1 Tax=Streptosporangium amethystogenes subsp. fukuiense TaxID=698418 RepID=A0ABW2T5V8_9ACTN